MESLYPLRRRKPLLSLKVALRREQAKRVTRAGQPFRVGDEAAQGTNSGSATTSLVHSA